MPDSASADITGMHAMRNLYNREGEQKSSDVACKSTTAQLCHMPHTRNIQSLQGLVLSPSGDSMTVQELGADLPRHES